MTDSDIQRLLMIDSPIHVFWHVELPPRGKKGSKENAFRAQTFAAYQHMWRVAHMTPERRARHLERCDTCSQSVAWR